MRFVCLLLLSAAFTTAAAQMASDDVDDLRLQNLPNNRVKLSWKLVPSVPCAYTTTYSIFRSNDEQFEPSAENLISSNISANSTIVKDSSANSYYHVRAVLNPIYCAPKPEPGFHGTITLRPLQKDEGSLLVSLRTKWRSVDARSGSLSFLIHGTYLGAGDAEVYVANARKCSYTLELTDQQGFKVKEIEFFFIGLATSQGKVASLEGNEITTLTNEQYKDFANGGDWTLEWVCRN